MMPLGTTMRTTLLAVSAINTSPLGSTATPLGLFRFASVAAAPSPANPGVPQTPAKVVMIPSDIIRTQ